jgi:hypothetical protein
MTDFQYDIAFSFTKEDEGIATQSRTRQFLRRVIHSAGPVSAVAGFAQISNGVGAASSPGEHYPQQSPRRR